jgi:hypothetical protein
LGDKAVFAGKNFRYPYKLLWSYIEVYHFNIKPI